MKVIVTKHVNLRLERPSVNAPNPAYFAPGTELKIVDTVTGDKYKDNDIWYKLENGAYVWSGALKLPGAGTPPSESLDWWHSSYKISDLWNAMGRGGGVKLAVVDTGVDVTHPALTRQQNAEGKDYSGTDFRKDNFVHGTPVAGIIFAESAQLTGVAPDASLYVVKASSTGTIPPDIVVQALEELPSDIDIVVLSHALNRKSFDDRYDARVAAVTGKRLIVCAIGNRSNHTGEPANFFPATIPGCISVAACDAAGKIYSRSAKSGNIAVCAPGVNMKALNPGNHAVPFTDSGTSYAAPFIAGILAIMKSHKKDKSNAELVKILCSSVTGGTANPMLFGSGIIDVSKIIKNLS